MTTATRPKKRTRVSPQSEARPTLGPWVCRWIERFLVHSQGDYLGQPFRLRPWQKAFIYRAYELEPDGGRRYDRALLGVGKGNGKGLALSEWIPTPTGWVRAAEVREGDELFGRDGRPTRVLGVYRQPEQPLYRVSFADGSSLVVDASHRWLVQVRDSSDARWKEWVVLTTRELIDRGVSWRNGRWTNYRFRVPVPSAVEYPDAELPIDPYVMGAWLGDGHVRRSDAGITSGDEAVLAECARLSTLTCSIDRYEGRAAQLRFRKPMKRALEALGLGECRAHTKRIPAAYLRSGVRQRWALLQGLLDTDGFASKAGQIEFTTTSRGLADDVTELVRSLGGIVTSRAERAPAYGYNGARRRGRLSWRLLIQLPEGARAFRLQRKQDRLRPRRAGWKLEKWRQIVAIEPAGEGQSVCFTVDAPDALFLAGRGFIPTHNTELAAALALAELAGPVVFDGWERPGVPRRPVPRTAPDIPIAAASFEQADTLFGAAKAMIQHGPLADFFECWDTEILPKGAPGRLYRVAAVAGTNDGRRPTFFVADELHEWEGRKERVYLVLSNGRSKRAGTWELAISTAGWDIGSLLGRLYLHGKRVQAGEVDDPRFLFQWWEAPEDLDLSDPEQLRQAVRAANPAAGDFLPEDAIIRRYYELGPSKEHEFRRYYLNQWASAPERWLPDALWAACAEDVEVPDGARIVIGFDGSYSRDSTAVVGCMLGERPHLFVIGHWERPAGASEDWRVDIPDVEETLRAACARWDVHAIACDPFRWQRTIQVLLDAGLPMVEWPSHSAVRMAPACAAFEDAVQGRLLSHDGDERLAEHIRNCVVKIDSRGKRITKIHKDSEQRIDLAVAAVIAYDMATRHAPEPELSWRPL